MSSLFGSICLSEIPREQMKKVMCKDGKERIFLNIWVGERKEPATFGSNTYTHYVSCSPKKEERKDGVNISWMICKLIIHNQVLQAWNRLIQLPVFLLQMIFHFKYVVRPI